MFCLVADIEKHRGTAWITTMMWKRKTGPQGHWKISNKEEQNDEKI